MIQRQQTLVKKLASFSFWTLPNTKETVVYINFLTSIFDAITGI